MRSRCGLIACSNPDAVKYYIERGIGVCSEWGEFSDFAGWALANGYDDTLTLDRIDNDKGYGPDNCRWATKTEQLRNRRDRKLTMEMAREIRRSNESGVSNALLASRYGVMPNHISRIVAGARWAE